MSEWTLANRPVTMLELSVALLKPFAKLRRPVVRYRIDPCCCASGFRFFGPAQVRAICRLIHQKPGTLS
jgi:hypothetical protein